MLGSAIYFADVSSYSAGFSISDENFIAEMLLCNVAFSQTVRIKTLSERSNHIYYKEMIAEGLYIPSSFNFLNDIKIPSGEIRMRNYPKLYSLSKKEYAIYHKENVEIEYVVRVIKRIKDGY